MKTLWLTIIAVSLALSLALAARPAGAEEEESALKTGVRSIVSDLVSAGKDLASGFNEGINESGKKGDNTETIRSIANQADFKRLNLSLKVIRTKILEPGRVELTVALKNPNEFPVRLTNLEAPGNVALVDRDGFSYALPRPTDGERDRDVLALGRSSTRLRYLFSDVEGRPDIFRFFDIDVPVK